MDRASERAWSVGELHPGDDVYGTDDQKVGTVAEVHDGYLIAEKGLFFPKDLTIPFDAVERIEQGRVYLTVTKDAVDVQGWDRGPQPAAGPAAEVAESEAAAEAAGGGATAESAGGEQRLTLREEELRATRQTATTGEVRVGKEVVEEERLLTVPVRSEHYYVERRPGDRRPAERDFPHEGQVLRFPVSAEHAYAEKVPVVREDVRVGKRRVGELRRIKATVRREEARVERVGDIVVDDDGDPEGAGR